MSCEHVERHLARYVAGDLTGAARRTLQAHLEGCPACRALVVEATRPLPGDALAAGETILAGVMARTTGGACAAAEARLPAFVRAELDVGEAELVGLHLSGCAPCRALAEILTWAPSVCREMGAVEPPAGFTAEVLARTSARPSRRLAARFRRGWRRLVERPRVAVELAYAGALVAVLLVGTPHAPLRHVLPEAARLARANPVELVATEAGSGGLVSALASATAWTYTQVARRVDATRRVVGEASSHAGTLVDAAFAGDIGSVGVQLRKVGGDLERLQHAIGDGVTGTSSHPHEESDT